MLHDHDLSFFYTTCLSQKYDEEATYDSPEIRLICQGLWSQLEEMASHITGERRLINAVR